MDFYRRNGAGIVPYKPKATRLYRFKALVLLVDKAHSYYPSLGEKCQEKFSQNLKLSLTTGKKREYNMAEGILESYSAVNPADPDIDDIQGMIETARAEERRDTASGKVALPDKMALLENIETVFILAKMNFVPNGVMNSVLRKTKLMEEKWGYSPIILVCDHNIDLRCVSLYLRQSEEGNPSKMKARTRMLGVYDYFQRSYAPNLENKAVFEKAKDGTRYEEVGKGVYDVYNGDELVRKEYFTGYKKCLRLVESIEGRRRAEGVYYDDWGYKNLVRVYDENDADVRDSYYTTGGEICIKAFSKIRDNNEYEIDRLYVYGADGEVLKECADNAGLAELYLALF